MIILSALVVVRSVVLKGERSRRRRTINLIVDSLGGSLVNVQISPEGKNRITSHGTVLGQRGWLIAVCDVEAQGAICADCYVVERESADGDREGHDSRCQVVVVVCVRVEDGSRRGENDRGSSCCRGWGSGSRASSLETPYQKSST